MKHKDRGTIYCNSIDSLVSGLRNFLTAVGKADKVRYDPKEDRRHDDGNGNEYTIHFIYITKGEYNYMVKVYSYELRSHSFSELLLICQERYEAIQNG